MNQINRNRPLTERLLQRHGGRYIVLIQSLIQLNSFLTGAIGIVFIITLEYFDAIQIQQLIICTLVLVVLYNLLLLIFMGMANSNTRLLLDNLVKGKPLPSGIDDNEIKSRAWHEVNTLPRRFSFAAVVTAYLLVVLPEILFMIRAGGATLMQAICIATGSIITTTFGVIQNTFTLDRNITPVRMILAPHNLLEQDDKPGIRMRVRILIVMAVIVLSTMALIILLSYQALANGASGTEAPNGFIYFINKVVVVLTIQMVCSIIIALQLSKSFAKPVDEMTRALDEIRKGNYNERAEFVSSDETLLMTIRLNQAIDQLEESRARLEHQVIERTVELTQRTEELRAAALVAREAASQQDLNQMLERTVLMITNRFGYYHTGIFLINETRDYAILRAASSEDGKRMVEKGHRLAIGQQGIVGASAYQNRPRVAKDVGSDATYFRNPELPLTRAEAAFPLSVHNEVIGVLDIQSTSVDVFSQSDVELLQTLADQIALAIQYARLLEENRATLHQIESSNTEAVRRAWVDRSRLHKKDYHYSPSGANKPRASDKPSGIGNRINIPINLRGQRIGSISLIRKSDLNWSDEDRSLAIDVANQVGLALENARLLDEAQRRAAQEQSISELAARLGRTVDPDSLLQTAVRELHLLPNVEEVSVYINSGGETTANKGTK